MARLPRLPGGAAPATIAAIWSQLQVWWQRLCEAIEAQETIQDATINRIRRILSHTEPTTILTAEDDGSDCTITIQDHVRIYGDGTTLSITGGVFPGKLSNTWYACYYDDPTLAETAPTFVLTTDTGTAQPNIGDGRHFCGLILTPKSGTGTVIESGGSYPAGSGGGVGSEINPGGLGGGVVLP